MRLLSLNGWLVLVLNVGTTTTTSTAIATTSIEQKLVIVQQLFEPGRIHDMIVTHHVEEHFTLLEIDDHVSLGQMIAHVNHERIAQRTRQV